MLDHRALIVLSLLPDQSGHLLDIGSGPVTPNYPFSRKAGKVTCLDWKMVKIDPIPSNVQCIEADFTATNLPANSYDTIIAADVFEHVLLEQEAIFVEKCFSLLKPGGYLVVSVPHRGTFAWLDPYNVKPSIHRFLWRAGLYSRIHNGYCDIRKGHKHYCAKELANQFEPLELKQIRYWGYVFAPLMLWASALRLPGKSWLGRRCNYEFKQLWGDKSFNMALLLRKPA